MQLQHQVRKGWICKYVTRWNSVWAFTFDSVVSAEDESDKHLNEVDAARPLPSPPCFLSPSALETPLLNGVGVLLRDCSWPWGDGFFSFLNGSSITVGAPWTFAGPLDDDVQLEGLGCAWLLTPFLETGRPRPPSTDWILRNSAGSSFCEKAARVLIHSCFVTCWKK